MKVENWPFTTISNKLEITMKSSVKSNDDECEGSTQVSEDQSDSLRTLTMQLNGVTLYLLFSFFYFFFLFLCLFFVPFFPQFFSNFFLICFCLLFVHFIKKLLSLLLKFYFFCSLFFDEL